MDVSGQLHDPAALSPGKEPVVKRKIPTPCRNSNPRSSSPQPSAIPLSYGVSRIYNFYWGIRLLVIFCNESAQRFPCDFVRMAKAIDFLLLNVWFFLCIHKYVFHRRESSFKAPFIFVRRYLRTDQSIKLWNYSRAYGLCWLIKSHTGKESKTNARSNKQPGCSVPLRHVLAAKPHHSFKIPMRRKVQRNFRNFERVLI
jgi:hypothetical protein